MGVNTIVTRNGKFNNEGVILEKLSLSQGATLNAIELEPNTWHTVFPLTEDAVILEVKGGPYTPTQESDFASCLGVYLARTD